MYLTGPNKFHPISIKASFEGSLLLNIASTVKPRFSGLFDYPDLLLWSRFFFLVNINNMWSWKIEAMKSSLILPNVCLKSRF